MPVVFFGFAVLCSVFAYQAFNEGRYGWCIWNVHGTIVNFIVGLMWALK